MEGKTKIRPLRIEKLCHESFCSYKSHIEWLQSDVLKALASA